jgi:metal-responsive CopG/Arc/MetJ family transcriptional regulator
MKRISIFIREDQFSHLSKLAESKKKSYAELIREAIDYKLLTEFGKSSKEETLKNSFGILKDRFEKGTESREIISNLRAEWEKRIGRDNK